MAYKLVTLQNLATFANEVKSRYTTLTAFNELSTKVDNLITAGGEPNVLEGVKVNGVALTIAEKMVDILIATGSANGTISVNNADVAIAGLQALAFKAQVSQADLDTALATVIAAKAEQSDLNALTTRVNTAEGKLTTLIGTVAGDDAKSVRTISAEEVAKIVAEAPESYDTLKELADWLAGHETDAAAMNAAIQTNKTNIENLTALVGTLPEGATSTTVVGYIAEAIAAIGIGDYAKTTEVASAISAAIAPIDTRIQALEAIDHDHSNKTVLDGITAEKVAAWDAAEQNAKTYADGLNTAMAARVKAIEDDYVKASEIEIISDAEITALFTTNA